MSIFVWSVFSIRWWRASHRAHSLGQSSTHINLVEGLPGEGQRDFNGNARQMLTPPPSQGSHQPPLRWNDFVLINTTLMNHPKQPQTAHRYPPLPFALDLQINKTILALVFCSCRQNSSLKTDISPLHDKNVLQMYNPENWVKDCRCSNQPKKKKKTRQEQREQERGSEEATSANKKIS